MRWHKFFFTSSITALFVFFACDPPRQINKPVITDTGAHAATTPVPAIIPKPNQFKSLPGSVDLANGLVLNWPTGKEWQTLATFTESALKARGVKVQTGQGSGGAAQLLFVQDIKMEGPEAYRLTVFAEGVIKITSASPHGAFYGLQSLLQSIENGKIACMEVMDAPRFRYRGMHLDVSRHFFPVDFIKQYIDLLAQYKMNTFHWHLTDDQGWRIEIKKYPKLQQIASIRKETLIGHYNDNPQRYDGKPYGGYYTQEQVKEIVQYAKERHVTVIPEIELPGHAQAALAAYPEFSCTGGKIEPATKWGVFEDVFCPKEETFVFLEDVLEEVMGLFPSEYIHIGGDECPKVRWKESAFCQELMKKEGLKDEHELQSYFIRRIGKFIQSRGRKMIGWDEILEGGLAPGATVMSWKGIDGGIAAARAGHDVVMTPVSHCYFDYYQSDDPSEPLAIGGYLPVQTVYAYEPIPSTLTAKEAKHVIGTQANLWTEYIPTPARALYMLLPRMPALAEVAWTQPEQKNLDDFIGRLQKHFTRWNALGLSYADKVSDVQTRVLAGDGKGVRVELYTLAKGIPMKYGLNEDPNTPYSEPILLRKAWTVNATSQKTDGKSGKLVSLVFEPHQAAGREIRLAHAPAPKYSGGGVGSCFNGIDGSNERYGDLEWLGFEGKDFEADIDFTMPVEISSATFRFFNGPGQWIYLPKQIELFNLDTPTPTRIAEKSKIRGEQKVVPEAIRFTPVKLKKMRIKVHNFGVIPEGAQGAGNRAWLFVDEVRIK